MTGASNELGLPRLLYFKGIKGRGEPIRLAFHLTGRKFENYEVPLEEWTEKEKPKAPSGQLPYIILPDNTYLTESIACVLYAGHGELVPTSPLELARVFEVLGLLESAMAQTAAYYKATDREAAKPEVRAKIEERLRILADVAGKHQGGSGFLVGNRITVADLCLYSYTDYMCNLVGIDLTKTPVLDRSVKAVLNHPKVKEYYSTH